MKTQDLFGRREECEVPQSRTQPRMGQGVKTDKRAASVLTRRGNPCTPGPRRCKNRSGTPNSKGGNGKRSRAAGNARRKCCGLRVGAQRARRREQKHGSDGLLACQNPAPTGQAAPETPRRG